MSYILATKIPFRFIFCLTHRADRCLLPSCPTSCSTCPPFRLNSLSALGHSYDSCVYHIEDARQTDSRRVRLYLQRVNHNVALEASSKTQTICAVCPPPVPVRRQLAACSITDTFWTTNLHWQAVPLFPQPDCTIMQHLNQFQNLCRNMYLTSF